MQNFLEYSAEVKAALKNNQPILALESTVITHGLPYPENVETARMLETLARENNAVPATIAILNGKIKIGLSSEELDFIAQDKSVIKASTQDIAYALTHKLSAGTTVAATMLCAHFAGIKVFATGGIGGVHRGEDQDISGDLIALSRLPVAVVCAGAKAILDIPRTLELLETLAVPIMGYQTRHFPLFYTPKSKHALLQYTDDIATLAQMIQTHWQLQLAGVLVANPIPVTDGIACEILEPIIDQALLAAKQQQISGKAVTPFLLKAVTAATEGKSLRANIALLKNNVKVGAQLANKMLL
jgi:pseudouridine-5'-phosphate glycosidase